VKRVLVIGGYGNFGSYISKALASDPNAALVIGGRSQGKADAFAESLKAVNPAQGCALDIDEDIEQRLLEIGPDIVIHTTGPFQIQNHRVARASIGAGAHYLDLADARNFVATIAKLDEKAKAAGVAVIAGASSVPCLTAAFIDRYIGRFGRLESVVYGIAAAQATNRGLGTAAAILSYVGKSFSIIAGGRRRTVYGWQGLHAVRYPELGTRLFGYCDIPDLELFPARYPDLRDLRFVAGHEVKLLHLGTWLLSWIVRLGIMKSLSPYAKRLLKLSFLFDRLGSDKSGFHMFLNGIGKDGKPAEIRIFMIARQVHGPNIPCVPAILLARRLAAGEAIAPGARPCLDLVSLDEMMAATVNLDIDTVATGPSLDERWLGIRSAEASPRSAWPSPHNAQRTPEASAALRS
jgi:saccharopine dehydrogenase-like NADP-dependent oxidoreductase